MPTDPRNCSAPPPGWDCSREPGHDGPCAAFPTPEAKAQRRIAAALAEWSSARKFEDRHPKNQRHWMLIAEALMSNRDEIIEPINAYVRERKREEAADV